MPHARTVFAFCCLPLFLTQTPAQQNAPLRLIQTIPLPGVTYLDAALRKKQVPSVVVADKEKADYALEGVSDHVKQFCASGRNCRSSGSCISIHPWGGLRFEYADPLWRRLAARFGDWDQ